MSRVVVASGNAHKIQEIAAMLDEVLPSLEVVGLRAYPGAPAIAETAETFAGNATLKAQGIADWLRDLGEPPQTAVLADDSGLSVDALGGAPGVYSARFAGPAASDADNNLRLVQALTDLGLRESPAHYTCVLAWTTVGGDAPVRLFEGRWDVQVRVEARGAGGFGYDPHAWLGGAGPTVAELPAAQKAELSHRGIAMRALCGWLGAAKTTGLVPRE